MTQKPFTLAELTAKLDKEAAEVRLPDPLTAAEAKAVWRQVLRPARQPSRSRACARYEAVYGVELY